MDERVLRKLNEEVAGRGVPGKHTQATSCDTLKATAQSVPSPAEASTLPKALALSTCQIRRRAAATVSPPRMESPLEDGAKDKVDCPAANSAGCVRKLH